MNPADTSRLTTLVAVIALAAATAATGAGADQLVNDNAGFDGTFYFTQSEASVVVSGSSVVVGFNDAGAATSGKYSGFAYSFDGGMTFTDGGSLPSGGDYGDPVLALDESTGRIYFSTLAESGGSLTAKVMHSDDQGVTWSSPVAQPTSYDEDKPWLVVDNFLGSGNGNVYLVTRLFAPGESFDGIFFRRSTNGGATFQNAHAIALGGAGAFVTVGPDHTVYAFWYERLSASLMMRKSVDRGITFSGPPVTVATDLSSASPNGDLGLTGTRQGTGTAAPFRTNSFPHAAVNPVSGHVYVTFNKAATSDKSDCWLVMSTDGGENWSSPIRVNDDATFTDQWQPTIAVTSDGSRLGIFYYSREEDPVGNNLFRYYARLASISGAVVIFDPSSGISDTASLPEFGRDNLSPTYMGDYNTAVAADGMFHVVWSDNRDDLPGGFPRKDPNVYYDAIPVGTTSVATTEHPVTAARLAVTTPNPFRSSTTLVFDLLNDGEVILDIYSATGVHVKRLAQADVRTGRHRLVWDGSGDNGLPLAAGVYFVRLSTGRDALVGKVVKTR